VALGPGTLPAVRSPNPKRSPIESPASTVRPRARHHFRRHRPRAAAPPLPPGFSRLAPAHSAPELGARLAAETAGLARSASAPEPPCPALSPIRRKFPPQSRIGPKLSHPSDAPRPIGTPAGKRTPRPKYPPTNLAA
jgi:hypothetical protein